MQPQVQILRGYRWEWSLQSETLDKDFTGTTVTEAWTRERRDSTDMSRICKAWMTWRNLEKGAGAHSKKEFGWMRWLCKMTRNLSHFEEECEELCGLLIARMTHTNRDVTVVSLSCTCHGNSWFRLNFIEALFGTKASACVSQWTFAERVPASMWPPDDSARKRKMHKNDVIKLFDLFHARFWGWKGI